LCLSPCDEEVVARRGFGSSSPEEVEGTAVGVGRLGVGEEAGGPLGSEERVVEGPGPRCHGRSMGEVVGEGAGLLVDVAHRLDGLGYPQVDSGPPGPAQPRPQRRSHQGVGEAVTVGLGLFHQSRAQRRLERLDGGEFIVAGCPSHHWDLELEAGHRRRAQDVAHVAGEARHPPLHGLGHRPG
jgi:hypothetical protein